MNGYLHQLVSRALDAAPVLKPRLPAWFEPVAPRTPTLQEIVQEQVAPTAPPSMPAWSSPPNPMPGEAPAPSAPPEIPVRVRRGAESPAAAPPAPAIPPTAASVRIEREIRERHEVLVERRIEENSAPPAPEPLRAAHRETSGPTIQPADARIRPRAESPIPAPPVSASLVPRGPVAAVAQAVKPIAESLAAPLPGQSPRPEKRPPPTASLVPKPVPTGALPPLRPAAVPGAVQAPPPDPAAPPVIEITIGRVEVRAVSAPPPAAPSRQRSAAPMLSLDDYLKQKDGRTA